MAQAARRRKSRRATRRRARGGWRMLVVGVIAGAILMALYQGYRENQPGQFGSGIRSLMDSNDGPPATETTDAPAPEPREPGPEVSLDYHEILPNIDKVLSQSDLEAEDKPVEKRPQYQYLLQAGSYRSERDAESMKAKLTLAGYEPKIQRVEIASRGTYYRVRLGPYQSKRKLRLDKKRLGREGVNAMALRLESR